MVQEPVPAHRAAEEGARQPLHPGREAVVRGPSQCISTRSTGGTHPPRSMTSSCQCRKECEIAYLMTGTTINLKHGIVY